MFYRFIVYNYKCVYTLFVYSLFMQNTFCRPVMSETSPANQKPGHMIVPAFVILPFIFSLFYYRQRRSIADKRLAQLKIASLARVREFRGGL